jgi:hypothetical protein
MKNIAESFSNLCISVYECWQMYKVMYKYNIEDRSGIWTRFGTILHRYLILQIARINDPEKHGKDYNLSLAYFVARINKPSYSDSYNKFRGDNGDFIKAIDVARNKVVAHPDLRVYTSDSVIGAFSAGLDEKYFDSLHRILSEGYKELGLGSFPEWPKFIINDTELFMKEVLKTFNA